MRKVLYLCLLLYSCKGQPVTVQRVIDGDTFVTTRGEHVRLAEIDAPEIGQFFGDSAKDYLTKLIQGRKLYLDRVTTDKYGRSICIARFCEHCSTINRCLASNGYVWVYNPLFASVDILESYQYARQHHEGMWKYSNNIPPFKYRQNEKGNYKR